MTHPFKNTVKKDAAATVESLAKDLTHYLREASEQDRVVNIALSGGSTPQLLFSILAGDGGRDTDWSRVHFFWVDERCVPAADSQSNYGNAQRILFRNIKISAGNIHPVRGDANPYEEALRYESEIRASLPSANGYPRFDLVLLGMGDDGHTASIFPGQEGLFDSRNICAVSINPATQQERITLTGGVINNAAVVIFLITGSSKRGVLRQVRDGSQEANTLPAARVKPSSGDLWWYVDEEAFEER